MGQLLSINDIKECYPDKWVLVGNPIMILVTGATNTTIDRNALYLLGYDLKDSIRTEEIETANGIIDTDVFEVGSFSSLRQTKKKFQIQVYDFLAHGIFFLTKTDFLDWTFLKELSYVLTPG